MGHDVDTKCADEYLIQPTTREEEPLIGRISMASRQGTEKHSSFSRRKTQEPTKR